MKGSIFFFALTLQLIHFGSSTPGRKRYSLLEFPSISPHFSSVLASSSSSSYHGSAGSDLSFDPEDEYGEEKRRGKVIAKSKQNSRARSSKAVVQRAPSTNHINTDSELQPRRAFDKGEFFRELNAAGIAEDSTQSDIEEKANEVMSRFHSQTQLTRALLAFLRAAGVKEDVILLVQDKRRRIIRREGKRRNRVKGQDEARRGDTGEKASDTELKEEIDPLLLQERRDRRERYKERKTREFGIQLESFKTKTMNVGLHYGMPPEAYVEKEMPLRLKEGSRIYGWYQARLQDAANVDPGWRSAYRLARKAKLSAAGALAKTAKKREMRRIAAGMGTEVMTSGSKDSGPMSLIGLRGGLPVASTSSKDLAVEVVSARESRRSHRGVRSIRRHKEAHVSSSCDVFPPFSAVFDPLPFAYTPCKDSRSSRRLRGRRADTTTDASNNDDEDTKTSDDKHAAALGSIDMLEPQDRHEETARPTKGKKTYRGSRAAQVALLKPAGL
ncbi:hypothetical protein CBS101457_002776 [Exobasidium rhododendri]|nr:hypothetical protein CBS101457_002776 [Exobasidium rhododendri]